eukprot:TRINITY_DN1286_c0_g1_i7.p1 TRINITY_DN1286_c0_g1~~TRINITY_DN1286_c0_g1_i7.p1  ORF type:complete len:187 (+),score=29.02 TRINITY_DN1286_c0_g1_i7:91-651(+)
MCIRDRYQRRVRGSHARSMADILGSASFDEVSLESPNTIALQEEASNIWTAFTAQTNHELPAFLKSRPEMKLSGKPGLNLKTVLHRLKKQPQGFQCSTQNDFAQYASSPSSSPLQVLRQFGAAPAARRTPEQHPQRSYGNNPDPEAPLSIPAPSHALLGRDLRSARIQEVANSWLQRIPRVLCRGR